MSDNWNVNKKIFLKIYVQILTKVWVSLVWLQHHPVNAIITRGLYNDRVGGWLYFRSRTTSEAVVHRTATGVVDSQESPYTAVK